MLGSIAAAVGSAAVGHMLNKSQQKAELESQKEMAGLNFEQQKWMAANKHQLEAEDLKKAGYNPALTAVGTSPGAGGAGGTAGTGITAAGLSNPIELAMTLMQQENNNALTAAKVENTAADTVAKTLNNKWIDKNAKQNIAESISRIAERKSQEMLNYGNTAESTERTKRIKGGKLKDYIGTEENPKRQREAINNTLINAAKKAHDYTNPIGLAKKIWKGLKG